MKYKCRAEGFIDVCTFFIGVYKHNEKSEEKIHIFRNKIISCSIDDGSVEYEFESNIDDCLFLKKLMSNINDLHIMYQTLQPIYDYTGETNMF